MVNPLFGILVLTPVEQAINYLIQDDPHLADLIEPFTGKLLELETRQPAAIRSRCCLNRVEFA